MLRNGKATALTAATLLLAGCAHSDYPVSRHDQGIRQIKPEAMANARPAAEPKILPETYFAAGAVLERQGLIGQAITQYRKAIAVNHDYAAAYHRLGVLHSMVGQYDEATKMLRQAVALEPDHAIIRNNFGFALMLQERWPDAEREFRRAIELRPEFTRPYINLGMALSRLERFDEAVATFRQVLPEADAYYNLGLMLRTQGLYDRAAMAFRRTLDLRPDFTAATTQLEQIADRLSSIVPVEKAAATVRRADSAIRSADKATATPVKIEADGSRPPSVLPVVAETAPRQPLPEPRMARHDGESVADHTDVFIEESAQPVVAAKVITDAGAASEQYSPSPPAVPMAPASLETQWMRTVEPTGSFERAGATTPEDGRRGDGPTLVRENWREPARQSSADKPIVGRDSGAPDASSKPVSARKPAKSRTSGRVRRSDGETAWLQMKPVPPDEPTITRQPAKARSLRKAAKHPSERKLWSHGKASRGQEFAGRGKLTKVRKPFPERQVTKARTPARAERPPIKPSGTEAARAKSSMKARNRVPETKVRNLRRAAKPPSERKLWSRNKASRGQDLVGRGKLTKVRRPFPERQVTKARTPARVERPPIKPSGTEAARAKSSMKARNRVPETKARNLRRAAKSPSERKLWSRNEASRGQEFAGRGKLTKVRRPFPERRATTVKMPAKVQRLRGKPLVEKLTEPVPPGQRSGLIPRSGEIKPARPKMTSGFARMAEKSRGRAMTVPEKNIRSAETTTSIPTTVRSRREKLEVLEQQLALVRQEIECWEETLAEQAEASPPFLTAEIMPAPTVSPVVESEKEAMLPQPPIEPFDLVGPPQYPVSVYDPAMIWFDLTSTVEVPLVVPMEPVSAEAPVLTTPTADSAVGRPVLIRDQWREPQEHEAGGD